MADIKPMSSPFGHPLADLRYDKLDNTQVVASFKGPVVKKTTSTDKPYYQLLFQIRGDITGKEIDLTNSHALQTLWPDSDWYPESVARLAGVSLEDLPKDQSLWLDYLTNILEDTSLALRVGLNRDGFMQVFQIIGRGTRIKTSDDTGLAKELKTTLPVLPVSQVPDCDKLKTAYQWITQQDKVSEILKVIDAASYIGVDLETDFGADQPEIWNASDGSIRLMQLSTTLSDGSIWTICIDVWQVNIRPILKALERKTLTKIIHYLPFEQQWLSYHYGMGLFENTLDTCLAWKVLERHFAKIDPSYEMASGQLSEVAKRLWGLELDKDAQMANWGSDDLPITQREYAALDAALMLPLYNALKNLALENGVWGQILAASYLTAEESFKKLPIPKKDAEQELLAKIKAATSRDELAHIAFEIRKSHLPNSSRQLLGEKYLKVLKEL